MMLREYQRRAIDMLYDWFKEHDGNPCLVLPTGSGKSHIVAALCKDAVQSYPGTRILMLTHVKELLEQNSEKMRQHWANAPLGMYSAGIGRKDIDVITFAGIQSIRKHANKIGHVDLCIIDECHLVSHKEEGGYRTLLADLLTINPNMRLIGLTATPYRLGHGLITDGEAMFDALIEPVSIEELIYKGFLAPLHSKVTELDFDLSGVKKRGGEYIESELQKAVDTNDKNVKAVREVIRLAGDRKAWLLFCTGVAHAHHIAEVLQQFGITAACITGDTPKAERQRILAEFKAGKIRAVTNANVLTTGFDYPDIDLIAMLRPTMSPTLYVQMAGRGMRPKSHTDHCLVLDFAGVVRQHGPITAVQPPNKKGMGAAPTKSCPNCFEIILAAQKKCECCGFEFKIESEEKEEKDYRLHDDDIMGLKPVLMNVSEWFWRRHISKNSGKEMLAVTYYGDLSDAPITEYLPVLHDGYAGEKGRLRVIKLACGAGASMKMNNKPDLDELVDILNRGFPPKTITYKREGKFFKVLAEQFDYALLGTNQGVAA